MQYEPLFDRLKREHSDDVLYEGIPEWLESDISAWIDNRRNRARGDLWGRKLRGIERNCRITLRWRYGNRSAHSSLLSGMFRDEELGLEVLQYLLAQPDIGGDEYCVENLECSFLEGGSAWMVVQFEDAARLERRVDDTVRQQYEQAAQEAEPSTAEHLRAAWGYLYGRNPDPSEAYDRAVKAVESATAPIIIPNDDLATLGKIKNALHDGMDKFEMEWASKQAQTGLDTVFRMMESLWTGQHDRHGTADSSQPTSVSPKEAEAGVHVAVSLVHIFASGLVKTR